MKIQLANRTYHPINEGCCLDCAFWSRKPVTLLDRTVCIFPFTCCAPFKKQLFNDKIFKL